MMKLHHLLALSFSLSLTSPLAAQKAEPAGGVKVDPKAPSPWGDFVEKDFPFFSSVLDAREVGEGFPKDNLTPRGIILNLGHNLWACFDTDLLRIAAIWQGEEGNPPVTPEALAPGSYHIAGQKTKDGQDFLPKPVGKVLLANGIYPGWQVGERPSFTDPREPTPSKEEVGRGHAEPDVFTALEIPARADKSGIIGTTFRYLIDGIAVTESFGRGEQPAIVWGTNLPRNAPPSVYPTLVRWLHVAAHSKPLVLIIGHAGTKRWDVVCRVAGEKKVTQPDLQMSEGIQWLALPASDKEIDVICSVEHLVENTNMQRGAFGARWPDTLDTTATLSNKPDAYVTDEIPLPVPNPWKRNVRLADIAFLNDQGDAAAVTFDGDVWLVSGLKDDLKKVTWKRFASGLHEPMSIVARKGELFVFDRNGIWKLVDTNNDRECDRYEMFCNLFAQTAETREFPNSMKLGPQGELYISKGGQEGTTFGKHNGTVIKIAPDGKSIEVIGYGLRQPFIGVNPKTGLVTASDQQGNYVPSTPLHIISGHHFYGHVPTIAPKEKYPEAITEPLTWLPHPVNPSGATQTWLLDAKMGPVNDELIHVGYNRPEIFRVLMNSHFTERPQAAVVSFSRDFDFGPLNAQVNPADGQLYVVGFQVWGTTAKKLSGLVRIRHTDKPRVLLKEVTPTDKGLLLRFNAKLEEKLATDPTSYSAERWNYRRTSDYGSPHLKLDGSTGQEWMTASSAYLSKDGMTVLVGFPEMKAGVNQMRIGWGLKSVDGLKAENTAYFSPWELLPFDAKKEGFDENLKVDLTPRAAATVTLAKPTVEEGERLYQMFGCMACHSTDGTLVGKVGPSWKGLFGSERDIAKGTKGKFKADEAYLRESITNPSAKVVKGFEKFDTGMPIYAGILNESQIESLILFIKSLK
ncbi:MAG: DUF6797 domain-containing protein [Prosthecobacter sp.]